jgi:hypothetical protein
MASKGDANFTSEGDVTVLYQGSTPTYDYTVINADSSDALMTWLSDNGWDPGETAASITDYVNEGGWQFVAVKTHMDAETDSVKTTLPPVKIRYAGDRIQYPARMGRYAQGDSLSSIVYVLGDQKARISGGWDQVDLPEVGDEGENPDYMQYEAYPERIAEIGSEGAYARTYADVYQSGWVTRFDTTSPVELNTVDVEFAVDDGTEAMHLVVTNKGPIACATSSGARSLGWLPLLALLWRRRR